MSGYKAPNAGDFGDELGCGQGRGTWDLSKVLGTLGGAFVFGERVDLDGEVSYATDRERSVARCRGERPLQQSVI